MGDVRAGLEVDPVEREGLAAPQRRRAAEDAGAALLGARERLARDLAGVEAVLVVRRGGAAAFGEDDAGAGPREGAGEGDARRAGADDRDVRLECGRCVGVAEVLQHEWPRRVVCGQARGRARVLSTLPGLYGGFGRRNGG